MVINWINVCILIILIISISIRGYYQHFNNKDLDIQKNYVSNKERLSLIGILLFGLIFPIIARFIFPQAEYHVAQYLQVIGLIISVLAIVLLQQAHATLDKQFSHTLALKQDHKLITTGIYKYVRHPMYLTAILMLFASSVLMPNYVSLASMTIAIIIILYIRVPEEEAMMLNEFGNRYKKYMDQSYKFIPKLY